MQTNESLRKSRSVVVVGAGTMGRGIAHIFAMGGYQTIIYDVSQNAADMGLAAIGILLAKGKERGKLSESDYDMALQNLNASADLKVACQNAGCIIEAVPEDFALKKKIFLEIGQWAPKDALLATNTSSLSVSGIAEAALEPSRVLGMHFFNPPHRLKLLEIVKAKETSAQSLELAKAYAADIDRDIVTVNDSPGFASSRLGLVLGLEAIRMLQEGVASAEDIDKAMTSGYGHPMGPLRLTDWVGLDIRLSIAHYLARELNDARFSPPQLLCDLVAEGKLGRKSGEGFYKWE